MLTIYRRHTKKCAVHRTRLDSREKRYYRDCDCPIWICGHTDTELFPRRSLGLTDWAAAEARKGALEKTSKDEVIHGSTVEDCIKRFLESAKQEHGAKTVGQYELLLGRLKTYCSACQVHFMHQVTTDLLEGFKVSLAISVFSRAPRLLCRFTRRGLAFSRIFAIMKSASPLQSPIALINIG